MINTLKLCFLVVGIMFWPVVSVAEVADSSSSNTDMSRDAWLDAVKKGVSVPVCKSFMDDKSIATQLSARHIDYNNCVSLMPAITDKCEKKYFASLPMVINDQNAEKWGRLLGECIGNDFAMSYLSTDENVTRSEEH